MTALDVAHLSREHPESRALWEGLAEGRLRLQRCTACGRLRFPPLATCPYCGDPAFALEDCEPRGTLYSWVVTHHAFSEALVDELPYVIATVTLNAGPRMFARLTGCGPGDLRDGLPLEGYPHAESGVPYLRFRPSG